MKNTKFTYIIAFTISLLLVISGCDTPETGNEVNENYLNITGEAQGTTYSITFLDSTGNKFSNQIADSIFHEIDISLSVWNENSTISEFNRSDSMAVSDPLFLTVFFRGREIADLTQGAFQPMIMPIVRAWGFGPEGVHPKGDLNTDSLMALVSTPLKVLAVDTLAESENPTYFISKLKGQELDVNGIAKGYTVDVLGGFLKESGIDNFMIEVGGEILVNGVNNKDEIWHIGIDKPVRPEENRELLAVAEINNRAVATSGSYRKYYESDGKRYSHTIDPSTGKPVDHNLLSTTVLAPNCANADAFATAFMVMGVEKSKQFIADHPELKLDVYLIYDEDDSLKTFMSSGLKEILKEI